MNRRTALFLSLIGGLVPRSLLAQGPSRRTASRSRNTTLEPGQQWRKWDIRRYTSTRIPHSATSPQSAIVEWIFRRTGTAVWHGEKLAALSASRTQIRAFHDAETLEMVNEVVERFVQAEE